MATFGSWFLAQAGRGDQVGYAARAWRDAKRKPRASAPATIANFLLADPDQVPELGKDEIEAAMAAAVSQYHEGNYHTGPAVPRPPLASVPGPPVPAAQGPAEGADDGQMAEWLGLQMGMLDKRQGDMDERLAGIQELVAERHDVLHKAIGRVEKRVADLHELYFSFLQASQPLLELAAELQEGGDRIGAMQAEAMDGDSPQSLSDQLGVTPAQLAAQQAAQRNGWLPGPGELVGPDTPAGQALAAQQARGLPVSYPGSVDNPEPGGGLYGAHAVPEPTPAQWQTWHEAGELSWLSRLPPSACWLSCAPSLPPAGSWLNGPASTLGTLASCCSACRPLAWPSAGSGRERGPTCGRRASEAVAALPLRASPGLPPALPGRHRLQRVLLLAVPLAVVALEGDLMSWWAVTLIALGAALLGGCAGYAIAAIQVSSSIRRSL